MQRTYKYRIYLTNGQRRLLDRQLEVCRWVYNETLAVRRDAYQIYGMSLSRYDTNYYLPIWKHELPERDLKLVHSQVLQDVQKRVDLAFQAFFQRVQEGADDPGYPRFKGFGRYDSLTYPQYGNGIEIRGDDLVVSKIGRVKVVWHRPIEGEIKTVTLRRSRTNKWYVTFSCEIEPRPYQPTTAVVGVDVGLKSFATLSNGEEVENPRFFRRDEKDLKRVQRAKDAAKKAENWPENARRKKALARIHERIGWRREDFAHKLSRSLVRTFQVIAFEDLNISNMLQNRRFSKSIADAAWNQLVTYTTYKAEEAGRTVVLVNPKNTTQGCSGCGRLVKKDVSVRVHACPFCGLVLDRDHNAAINILRLGLQSLEAHPL